MASPAPQSRSKGIVSFLKRVFSPFYRAWMLFAEVLGWFMSRVILTVLYVFMFTPVSFVMFIIRRDPLTSRPRKNLESYFTERPDRPFDPERCQRQF